MTYGHLQADSLYTGISSGRNACIEDGKAFTFTFTLSCDSWNTKDAYEYTVNHKKTWHFIFDYNFG